MVGGVKGCKRNDGINRESANFFVKLCHVHETSVGEVVLRLHDSDEDIFTERNLKTSHTTQNTNVPCK